MSEKNTKDNAGEQNGEQQNTPTLQNGTFTVSVYVSDKDAKRGIKKGTDATVTGTIVDVAQFIAEQLRTMGAEKADMVARIDFRRAETAKPSLTF